MISPNRKYRSALISLAATVAVLTPALAQYVAQPEELIDFAISKNPEVLATHAEKASSVRRVDAAKYQYYPSFTGQIENGEANNSQAVRTLRVEQTLWSGGRIAGGVDASEASLMVADARSAKTRLDLALQVVDAWEAYSTAAHTTNAQMRLGVTYGKFLSLMERRVAAGISSEAELLLLRARTAQNRLDTQTSNLQYQIAFGKLQQLCNCTILDSYSALALNINIDSLKVGSYTENEGVSNDVVSAHPYVKINEAEYKLLEAQIRISQSQSYPTVYAAYQATQPLSSGKLVDGAFFGVKYSPGAGLSAFAETQALKERILSVKYGTDSARLLVREQLMRIQSAISSNESRIPYLEDAITASKELNNSNERLFILGKKTINDVLDSAREVEATQISSGTSKIGLISNAIRLKLHQGKYLWQRMVP